MTAEIVIINQQAVTLAADSAVTIGKNRVWKHANKIFSAGHRNDIGIMIYNAGDFLSIPWEVAIKQHRNSIKKKSFNKLNDYANDFVKFISSDIFHIPEQENLSFQLIMLDIISGLQDGKQSKNKSDFHAALSAEISNQKAAVDAVDSLACPFDIKKFSKTFSSSIKDLANEHFKYRLSRQIMNELIELCYAHVTHCSMSEYFTGIVITGYGKDELFPSVAHYVIDGRSLGMTRIWRSDRCIDLNVPKNAGAAIIPFAQADMAHLFMEGILEQYLKYIYMTTRRLLTKRSHETIDRYVVRDDERVVEKAIQNKENDDIMKKFMELFASFRENKFTKPIMRTIRALPKEEMAFMARAMVEITALRRRFASSVESVGGDIDVAIISKSDGFVWIARKHYFDLDLNTDFVHRKSHVRGD